MHPWQIILPSMKKIFSILSFFTLVIVANVNCVSSSSHKSPFVADSTGTAEKLTTIAKKPITAADQTSEYLAYLKGKKIGILINQTSIIGNKPIVDSLVALGVNVVRIFGPEHGFRGTASNAAQ